MSEDLQKLVDTAEASITAAAAIAETDKSRPLYHFRAPSQWMDDPNGIIFHDGWYHMMYSLNPHSAEHRAGMVYKTAVRVWDPNSEDWTGGITVWGHARSRDLVHWEHLPIAVYPSIDKGEHFVWFGCTVINDEGIPMATYTAVGPDLRPEDTAQQWAAIGSPDLMSWKPLPSNPMIDYDVHNGEVIGEWRDPFVFKAAGRTFMVLGGRKKQADGEGRAVVALYEATNPSFTKWVYRGIIFTHPRSTVPSAECPNLFKLDGKWVMFVSPHAEVEYYVGELDLENYTFSVEGSGVVDHSRNFYATNVLFDGDGRAVCWGALVGFTDTIGWNCCVSLPRELKLEGGKLVQRPVQELDALLDETINIEGSVEARTELSVGKVAEVQALEISCSFDHAADESFGLRIRNDNSFLDIAVSQDELQLGTLTAKVHRNGTKTELRLFIDRTVAEIFLNSETCAAKVIPLMHGAADISIWSSKSAVQFKGSISTLRANDLFTSSRG